MKKVSSKKLLSAILALVMILSTLVVLPLTASAAGLTDSAAWDGSTKTQPAGEGTSASPYQIASGANLAWVSAQATTLASKNAVTYLKVTANINLNNKPFTPIDMRIVTGGNETDGFTYAYKGMSIDGQGATISGLNVAGVENAGLFANIGNGATISNLHFVGATVASKAEGFAGVLAGQAQGPVTVTGCSTDATSSVVGYVCGGFIGRVIEGGKVTLEKCLNRASVTGNSYEGGSTTHAAGMVGRHLTGSSVTFKYCVNEGTMSANATGVSSRISGILGHSPYKAANTDEVVIENCYNVGAINATITEIEVDGNVKSGYAFVGAMVGHMQGSLCKMTNCYDYSTRDLNGSSTTYHYAMIGDGAGAETAKHLRDLYVVIHPDTQVISSAVMRPAFLQTNVISQVNFDNAGSIKPTLTSEITVVDGGANKTSTIAAEMAKIAEMVGTTAPSASAGASDDMTRDYSWYTADGGTEAAPYEIANAAQFAAFSALSNGTQKAEETNITGVVKNFNGKYFKLTGDIDLTGYAFAPINIEGNAMVVHFDGAGHTISNLTQEKNTKGGLFALLNAGSTFKNVTLKDSTIVASATAAGFVAETNGSISFKNCKTENVTITAAAYAAGFVAYNSFAADAENRKMSFEVCVNDADIALSGTGESYAAGFFAYGDRKSDIYVSTRYCVNKGDITVMGVAGSTAAGIIGKIAYDYSASNNTLIEGAHCYNTGKLSVNVGTDKAAYVGGYLGWGNIGGEMYLDFIYDYSARATSDNSAKNRNGGIVGECANTELIKMLNECFAANEPTSESVYSVTYAATRNASTLADATSEVVMSLTDEVVFQGAKSTLQAQLARIDAVLASVDAATGEYTDPYPGNYVPAPDPEPGDPTPGEPTPGEPTPEEPKPEDNKTNDTTTKAPDTTAAPSGGCGSSVTATFAVVAMTALCGMAIVGKKKED